MRCSGSGLSQPLQSLIAFGILLAGAMLPAAESSPWSYRGFRVSHAGKEVDGLFHRAVAAQIDIILSVGLDTKMVRFMQSVPLVLVSAESIQRTPGLYFPQGRVVKLTSEITSVGHKPVLLHELLHAYHDQELTDGLRNPQVLKLYQEAKGNGTFKFELHMMQNPSEYLACAGTTFLFGVTGQEPFRRMKLREQPGLLEFLQALFGPTCGRYDGSLSSSEPDQAVRRAGASRADPVTNRTSPAADSPRRP